MCPQSSQKCKQKILVKLSKYISPEFAASVLETNVVATEEHDLDFSFCLMTSLSMFQQLFSLRWLMQQQEKKVYHFVLVGSPGLHKYMTSVNKVSNDLENTKINRYYFFSTWISLMNWRWNDKHNFGSWLQNLTKLLINPIMLVQNLG